MQVIRLVYFPMWKVTRKTRQPRVCGAGQSWKSTDEVLSIEQRCKNTQNQDWPLKSASLNIKKRVLNRYSFRPENEKIEIYTQSKLQPQPWPLNDERGNYRKNPYFCSGCHEQLYFFWYGVGVLHSHHFWWWATRQNWPLNKRSKKSRFIGLESEYFSSSTLLVHLEKYKTPQNQTIKRGF